MAWAQEVQCEFGLRQEEVPAVLGERWGHPCKDSQKVVLEGSYSSFSAVASMHVRRDQLVFAAVGGDCVEECAASFVIEDVYIRCRVLGHKSAVEVLVCCNAVAIMLRWEGTHEDSVGLAMQGHHYVLVAAACARSKSSSVIGEYVVDRDDLDVDGWFGWKPGC